MKRPVDRLAELLKNPVRQEVPKGWKTTAEIAREIGLSESQTNKLLRDAVQKGTMERKEFRIDTGGMMRPIRHYKEI
jgi:predicted transcriptional regulator